MDHYLPREITDLAKQEARGVPPLLQPPGADVDAPLDRRPKSSAPQRGGDRIKLKVLGKDGLLIDRENLELRYLEQLPTPNRAAARWAAACCTHSGIFSTAAAACSRLSTHCSS